MILSKALVLANSSREWAMAKARDKAGKKGDGQGSQASKAKERGERARLRKGRERNSASFCSNVDDREFEAQVRGLKSP